MEFFIYFSMKEGDETAPPPPENMAEMSRFMEESIRAGMVVSTGHLAGTVSHVTLKEGEISVTDGPFIEAKELIPGFTIIRTDTEEEALEWTKKLRRCMGEGVLRMARIHLPGRE